MSCMSCVHCVWVDHIKQQRCPLFKDYNLLSLGFKQCKSFEREPGADEHEYPETIESEVIAITQGADMTGAEIDIIEQFNRGKL